MCKIEWKKQQLVFNNVGIFITFNTHDIMGWILGSATPVKLDKFCNYQISVDLRRFTLMEPKVFVSLKFRKVSFLKNFPYLDLLKQMFLYKGTFWKVLENCLMTCSHQLSYGSDAYTLLGLNLWNLLLWNNGRNGWLERNLLPFTVVTRNFLEGEINFI